MHQQSQAGMCKTRLRRRFIHGASCGCKVRVNREVIIDPAVDLQGEGKPENASNGNAEGQ
jgi:hypothetical protein